MLGIEYLLWQSPHLYACCLLLSRPPRAGPWQGSGMTRGLRTSLFLLLLVSPAAAADELTTLSERFWRWRAETQPFTGDDIPRIARPAGWVPDWSAAAVAKRRTALAEFEQQWRASPARSGVAGGGGRRRGGAAPARGAGEPDPTGGRGAVPGF